MSKRYPREFRDDVVRVALARDPGVPLARIAADFGVGKSSLQNFDSRGLCGRPRHNVRRGPL